MLLAVTFFILLTEVRSCDFCVSRHGAKLACGRYAVDRGRFQGCYKQGFTRSKDYACTTIAHRGNTHLSYDGPNDLYHVPLDQLATIKTRSALLCVLAAQSGA
jgi:hypothetical protein